MNKDRFQYIVGNSGDLNYLEKAVETFLGNYVIDVSKCIGKIEVSKGFEDLVRMYPEAGSIEFSSAVKNPQGVFRGSGEEGLFIQIGEIMYRLSRNSEAE